ncbi:MAG: exodeoxyribonuclease VII small subunit [Thermodesulfovibrionales bacterium]|nr:exodeoxyribonuclease VII small subunit [Thermodesulfovibrionales bacterium]
MKYSEALSELEKIVKQIENEEIDIDTLTEKIKRADYLCKFCRAKLRSTEEEVKSILREIEQPAEDSS